MGHHAIVANYLIMQWILTALWAVSQSVIMKISVQESKNDDEFVNTFQEDIQLTIKGQVMQTKR